MATTDLERLIVSLEASTVKYERALARANGQTNTQMRRIENRIGKMSSNVNVSFGKAFAGIASIAALKGAQSLIDSAIKIENSLKVAGLAGDELDKVYQRLFASAQRNAAPLEALATLYGRVAQVQGELGISSDQLAKFADNVAVALRVSGRTAEESRGALLQLGQALGGTIVRAEEFNSINEGALPILQSVARGLKEAGGSVAQLRSLVINGEVSSKAFFAAFEAGAVTLQDKVATAEFTVSQGFTRLQNVLIDTAGKIDDATGASNAIGGSLNALAGIVQKVGNAFRENKGSIAEFFGAIQSGATQTDQFLKGKTAQNGETVFFEPIDFGQLQGWIMSLFQAPANPNVVPGADLPIPLVPFGGLPVPGGGTAGTRLGPIQGPPRPPPTPARPLSAAEKLFREADAASLAPRPVSLDDYPINPDEVDAATKALQKQQQAVKDLISDLEFEKSIVGLSEVEQQKMIAARKAGSAATEEQKAQIMQLTEELYYEQEAVQYLKDLYDELGNIGKAAVNGVIDALADGKIEAAEFGEILSNVLAMAGQFFLNQAFGSGSNGFASLLGGLFGFGGGRAAGGPVEAGKIYKVNENTPNSEFFAPGMDGMIIPRISTASGGASSRGGDVFHIDARGAQLGVGAEIQRALEAYDRYKLPNRVNQINKDPLSRG